MLSLSSSKFQPRCKFSGSALRECAHRRPVCSETVLSEDDRTQRRVNVARCAWRHRRCISKPTSLLQGVALACKGYLTRAVSEALAS